MDDILIKYQETYFFIMNLKDTFSTFREYGMKIEYNQVCLRGQEWEVSRVHSDREVGLRLTRRKLRLLWRCTLLDLCKKYRGL